MALFSDTLTKKHLQTTLENGICTTSADILVVSTYKNPVIKR